MCFASERHRFLPETFEPLWMIFSDSPFRPPDTEPPDVPKETFEKTLSSLRNTHRQLFTPTQHLVILQIALSLATSPSFYLPSSVPLKAAGGEESDGLVAGLSDLVSRYVEEHGEGPARGGISLCRARSLPTASRPNMCLDSARRSSDLGGHLCHRLLAYAAGGFHCKWQVATRECSSRAAVDAAAPTMATSSPPFSSRFSEGRLAHRAVPAAELHIGPHALDLAGIRSPRQSAPPKSGRHDFEVAK